MSDNHFVTLASIDVSKHIEKKQNLSYLSWPWAIDQLMRHDPSANWEFHKPEMFEDTMMVSCTVTAFNKPIKMHLPVMDHRNQAVKNPDAFIINKNMMRCLVKAIACHGLGLYIYAGEDLPDPADAPAPKPAAKAPPKLIEGTPGGWQLSIKADKNTDFQAWIWVVMDASRMALKTAQSEKDVLDIFRVNRVIFDTLKVEAPEDYVSLMRDFRDRRESFKEKESS